VKSVSLFVIRSASVQRTTLTILLLHFISEDDNLSKPCNEPRTKDFFFAEQLQDINLNHFFVADFVVFDKIILEVKSVSSLDKIFTAHCINYLRASSNKLALLVNFGEEKLNYKRIVL